MPIDPSLLIKAAKVYEAAEAVDGMKPKEVYESHKKCTPGEFGMNKEGYAKLQQAITKVARQKQSFSFMPSMAAQGAAGFGAAGAGLGGLVGAAYGAHAPGEEERDGKKVKRDRLMGALRGLAAGGLIGGGAGAVGGGGYGAYQGYMMDQMPASKLINAMEGVTNFIDAAKSKAETNPGFQKATDAGKSLWDVGKSFFNNDE